MVTADTEPVSVESRRAWFREHDPGSRPIWVAEIDGEIAGWISLSDFYDARPAYHATAEVGVYVAEDYRRRGVGRRLLQEAIRRGPALGLKTLTAGPSPTTVRASSCSRRSASSPGRTSPGWRS